MGAYDLPAGGAPMRIEAFSPDEISVSNRARARLDEAAVGRLMESIRQIGLREPPTVRVDLEKDDILLVAGLHRVEACKRLGWTRIECEVWDGSEIDARLWELAENLHRAELTALERDEHIAEWVKLTEEKKGAQVAPPGGKQPHDKGIKAAVRELGVDRTSAQRAVKVAGISEEAKQEARDAGLDDNHAALLAAAKEETPEAQTAKLREIAKRKSDRKLLQDAGDDLVRRDADDEAAEIIHDYVPEHMETALLDRLDAARHHKLAAAIRRLRKTGERRIDAPVFDSTKSGRAA